MHIFNIMKQQLYFIVVFCLLISLPHHVAAINKIDSLELELSTTRIDAEKISLSLELAQLLCFTDFDKSLYYANRALEVAEKINDNQGIVRAYYVLGRLYHTSGNYEKALAYSHLVIEKAADTSLYAVTGRAYQQIGKTYYLLGNYAQAFDNYLKSLDIFTQSRDTVDLAKTLNNIGLIHLSEKNYPKALEYFFKSLSIFKQMQATTEIANVYNNIGKTLKLRGDYQEALNYFHKSLKSNEALGRAAEIAESYQSMGVIYYEQGKYTDAYQHFKASLLIHEKSGNLHGIAIANRYIGLYYMTQNQFSEALRFLEKAYSLSQQLNSPVVIRDAAQSLSELYAKQNNFRKAYDFMVVQKQMSDSINLQASAKKLAQLDMQHEFDKQQQRQQWEQQQRELLFETQLNEEKSSRYFYMGGFAIVLIFSVLLSYSFSKSKRANKALEIEKQKVQRQNVILRQQQHEIQQQHDEIEQQRDQLETLNVTKDKFFSIIAHDLKNPFNALIGFTDILLTDYNEIDNDEKIQLLKIVNSSSKETHNLLKNLLQWARSQSGTISFNPEEIDVKQLIKENIDLLQGHARSKHLVLESDMPENYAVFADRNMVTTIIRNLLSNAIKFSFPDNRIKIKTIVEYEQLGIQVIDYGTGINPKDLKKLFKIDQYHSMPGTSNEKGTGLGLIVCKEFAQKNNGNIVVESKENEGSIFTLFLPLVTEEIDE